MSGTAPPRDRRPLCGGCGRGIRACAPCCRHGGWVHRADGKHEHPDGSPGVAFMKINDPFLESLRAAWQRPEGGGPRA